MQFVWWASAFLLFIAAPVEGVIDGGLVSGALLLVLWVIVATHWLWVLTPTGRVYHAAKIIRRLGGDDAEALQLLDDYSAFFRTNSFDLATRSVFVERMRSKAASLMADEKRRVEHQRELAKTSVRTSEAELNHRLDAARLRYNQSTNPRHDSYG